MYEVIFENDNGKKFVFGQNGGNWFGIDIGDGLSVDIGLSQGFADIGTTVETKSIAGRYISVTGKLFGDIPEGKDRLRNACAPLASGRLVFNGQHFARVHIKDAPSFSAVKNNGLFRMRFYLPFPFYYLINESHYSIGGLQGGFRFPVNYSKPHHFGITETDRYKNVRNTGDVKVSYKLTIQSRGVCVNPTLTNIQTFAFIKLNGTIETGESVTVYRDDYNVLRAELSDGNTVTDIISWIDDASTLFDLEPGDNLIAASAESGGSVMSVSMSFYPAVGVLYET